MNSPSSHAALSPFTISSANAARNARATCGAEPTCGSTAVPYADAPTPAAVILTSMRTDAPALFSAKSFSMRSLFSSSAAFTASPNVCTFSFLSWFWRASMVACCDFTDASRLLIFSCAVLRSSASLTALCSADAAFCSSASSCLFISSMSVSVIDGCSSSFLASSGSASACGSSSFLSRSTAFGLAAMLTRLTSRIVISSRSRTSYG